MLRRRYLLLACSAVVAVPSFIMGQGGAVRNPTLTDLLVNGLRATRAEEKAYIARVVEEVNQGELKESLVKAVFQKARNRNSKHPFPYFKAMLDAIRGEEDGLARRLRTTPPPTPPPTPPSSGGT